MTPVRPAVDPELTALLADLPLGVGLDADLLPVMRQFAVTPPEEALRNHAVTRHDHAAVAPDGTAIPLTVLTPADHVPGDHLPADLPPTGGAPCVYWIHGGGMVMGDRFSQIGIPLDWLAEFGAVVVSVEYRLAPEATGTTAVEDCHHGLLWVAEHAAELGVDPARIVVAGVSAGGGLAAGAALLARDRGTPPLAAQVLVCPMLDHRNSTVSSAQFTGTPGVWTGEMNAFGWQSLLGGLDPAEVPAYVSPALAADLSGLPPTYIDAGSAEVFRDEDVAYAAGIWAAGGSAELHVWDGGFHGFDALFPEARLSVAARRTRSAWLARTLSASPVPPGPLDPAAVRD
ncbi:alpha/beta hydrolase [Streptomycetaceae bacterium NBC_01309]